VDVNRTPITAVLGAAALLAAAAPTSASADTTLGRAGGLAYVESDPVLASAGGAAELIADCPGRKKVIGGGVAPDGGSPSESRVNSTRPLDTDGDGTPDDAWAADAYNVAGAPKSFSAYAICKKHGPVRYRSQNRFGLEPGESLSESVACPDGTHAAGGGVFTGGLIADGFVNSTHPFDDSGDGRFDDGWTARVFNTGAIERNMVVFVTCLEARLRYATSSSGFAACPGSTRVTGGGVVVPGDPASAWLTSLRPYADRANPPDDGFTAVAHSPGGPAPTSIAICLR
jgi:hypothetical protein